MTGFLHGRQLVDAYLLADVYVQISRSETYGLCLMEALACGLPAVILRAPGLAANLPPDCGADVLEPEELSTMANRCVALVSDRDRYQEHACQARAFAIKNVADGDLARCMDFHKAFAR